MKKIIALLLALLMMASFAACGSTGSSNETSEPETTVENTTEELTEGNNEEGTAIEGIEYFSLTLGENYESIKSLSAYYNEDGTVTIEYTGDVRKIGTVDASAMATIQTALDASGMAALNGQEDYQEGEANGSMYITYGDGTMLSAGFSGVIPEAFSAAFAAMDTCFQTITAEIPEYVPQPQVMGEIADSDKTALDAILSGMTLEAPDAFMISGIAKDEYFAVSMGLSSDEGIASGVLFKPMMMPGDYTLSIVTLEEGTSTEDVVSSFESAMDWRKNICPPYPTTALIATKDNQVLCLMGSEDLYTQTATAIADAGWTTAQTLTNPDM